MKFKPVFWVNMSDFPCQEAPLGRSAGWRHGCQATNKGKLQTKTLAWVLGGFSFFSHLTRFVFWLPVNTTKRGSLPSETDTQKGVTLSREPVEEGLVDINPHVKLIPFLRDRARGKPFAQKEERRQLRPGS